MDQIDRKICKLLQQSGRMSNAEIANAVGVPVSTANDRVRRLVANGTITGWHVHLAPDAVGADLCCFVMIDMAYQGEAEACAVLVGLDEVQELHHISGAHSYLMKLRLRNTKELQAFMSEKVKPLPAVQRTETIFSMDALKESSALRIAKDAGSA
ncbi:Lrp/AsnC family transcriptional regulator [Shimia thalassica]|uniref:Lrp/AsnC family transcriptional regulator n=1 Tax=Shimia thalassica TaxID=1715693 RepID=UPI0026E3B937|nr:Lrp/AsnC family transcriptional regulator [Shimia thalassica]MDO6523849.1 Lrp/AsnC family transcriptional regulator [Shimia thalassica]